MQPYFIPYAGYFRLFAASDLFVIYDCVQFPRRGWVHRNKLIDASGTQRWVTLPLAKAPQNVLIKDLRFPPDASALLHQRLRSFPALEAAPAAAEPIVDVLMQPNDSPLSYIEKLLRGISVYLGLPWNVIRSSSLGIPEALRGQDRILEIIRRVGARRYINASGGREIYSQPDFAEAGVSLNFLPEYQGPTSSILARILTENRNRLAADIAEFTLDAAG
jgi:WbqC-like protein family